MGLFLEHIHILISVVVAQERRATLNLKFLILEMEILGHRYKHFPDITIGKIKFSGMALFIQEPTRLIGMNNVFLTPHIFIF